MGRLVQTALAVAMAVVTAPPAPPAAAKNPAPPAAQPAAALSAPQPAPSPRQGAVDVRDGPKLMRTLEANLTQFVQNNYPTHLEMVMRGLQDEESRIRKELGQTADFFKTLALSKVSFNGVWEDRRGKKRYVLLGTVHGLVGVPKASLTFHTYPGSVAPVTVVQVDKESDGKIDEESAAFCRRSDVEGWLKDNLPRKAAKSIR